MKNLFVKNILSWRLIRFVFPWLCVSGLVLLLYLYYTAMVRIPLESLSFPAAKKRGHKTYSSNGKCKFTQLQSVQEIVTKIERIRYRCSKVRAYGGFYLSVGALFSVPINLDGQKWVCLDSKRLSTHSSCLVYSFGINNEWSFDDAIATQLGCQVHSFDPSMEIGDHDRSDKIHFHNIGLSDYGGINSVKGKDWKMLRLEDIRKNLGHETTVIDYLKMDIEGWELFVMTDIWKTSSYIFKYYVAQIGMEIHFSFTTLDNLPSRLQKYWSMLEQLECLGFELLHSEPNPVSIDNVTLNGGLMPCCYEVVWINTNLL